MDTSAIIDQAVALGIELTNADVETQVYQCWADRVAEAQMHFERDDMARCQRAIDDAHLYVVH